MAITATYIGQSTVKITNSFAVASGLANMVPFMTFANAIADAITGARPTSTDVSTISATALVNGSTYTISEVGTTDFTLIGAASNTVGLTFTASTVSVATGTGKVSQTNIFPGVPSTLSNLAFGVTPGVSPQLSSGWELFDSFWGDFNSIVPPNVQELIAETGDSESPIYTQVFRSLNADGVTYKNIILRYNTIKMELLTTTCEKWEVIKNIDNVVVGRTITNEAWTYHDCAPVGYNLTSCDMLVMVSPHWCVFHSYINDEPSLWAGVFESTREDVLDTAEAGNPCWGWMGSTLMMLGAEDINKKPLNGTNYTLWSMPRTKQGYTKESAAKAWGADYGATFHPHFLTTSVAAFIYYLGNSTDANKFTTSGWDPTRKLAMPVKPISDYESKDNPLVNYGGIYGLKIIAPSGANMNKIIIPTDKVGNSSPVGIDRYHWLLNNQFKRQASDVNSWGGNTTWAHAAYSLEGGSRPEIFVTTGTAHYVIDSSANTIIRLIASTGEKKKVVSLVAPVSAGIAAGTNVFTDMKYDGERYIYITSNKGLYRLDTANDLSIGKVTTVGATPPPTNGFQTLAITGDSVVCAPKDPRVDPIFYRYKRTRITETTNSDILPQTIAQVTTKASTADTPALPGANPFAIFDMAVDFEGNVWAATTGTTDANNRLVRVGYAPDESNPEISQLVAIPYSGFGGGIDSNNVGVQVLNGDNLVVWHIKSGGLLAQVQVRLRTIVKAEMVIATKTVGNASLLMTPAKLTVEKIDGILFVMPRNSGRGNYCFSSALGNAVGVELGAPVLGSDQYGVGVYDTTSDVRAGIKALSGSSKNSFIYYDGARIYSNSESALKIYVNIHGSTNTGGAVINATTVGQIAIPA